MSISDETFGNFNEVATVACLGGGLIGRSWAVLFLAAGKSVNVYDPDPKAETRLKETIESAWPVLKELGLTDLDHAPHRWRFCSDPKEAVKDALFIQESIPEQIELKRALYSAIEPVLDESAIVASSASGLTLSELQTGWSNPARFVLGHPFNPPHLIPLVEVMGNEKTLPGIVDQARAFYESAGKVTIEVKREVPGHVANRLQAALWREAIHLVNEGVASVKDVDIAVSSGPGLRWAVMGPTSLFHLGGDVGGLQDFCNRYSVSFNRWWDDLGEPTLDEATIKNLVAGFNESNNEALADMVKKRDRLLSAIVAVTHSK